LLVFFLKTVFSTSKWLLFLWVINFYCC
jgi:hypothetical protein